MAIERFKIPFEAVESSTLAGIGYEPTRQILAVQFRDGRIWHYAGASLDLVTEFYQALSKGSFYNENIRGKLTGEAMTGDCPKCGAHGWIGDTCEDCGCAAYVAKPRPVLHWGSEERPNGRQYKGECGAWVPKAEIARGAEHVTCERCKAIMARLDDAVF